MNVLFEIAYLVIIGFVAGWLASTIVGDRRRYGLMGYMIVGVVGAIGGNYAFASLQLPNAGIALKLLAALVGALVLVVILRLLRR